jgi:hypothetical protein
VGTLGVACAGRKDGRTEQARHADCNGDQFHSALRSGLDVHRHQHDGVLT